MFNHGYRSYMDHAFPCDELQPVSCSGMETWGGYSLTLIDALDTLVVCFGSGAAQGIAVAGRIRVHSPW